jgi:hypothetical protein
MGRVYTVTKVATTIATATPPMDLLELGATAGQVIVIHSAFVGQNTDAGDANAQMVRIQINRYATSGSGGGTALVARPHNTGDAAFGGTVDDFNTTQGGTATLMLEESFNVQAGWYYTPTPEERIVVPPSGFIAISIPQTDLTNAIDLCARITFEVLGGA